MLFYLGAFLFFSFIVAILQRDDDDSFMSIHLPD